MVRYSNVSFKYEDSKEKSINNINFNIESGELVVLTGLSGSGKSTIVKSLNGLIPKTIEGELTGDIFIKGEDLKDKKIHEISNYVGSVFQDPRGQFFTTNTTSELAFSMENFGYPIEKMKLTIEEVVKLLKIEYLLDREIFNISSGERQKLSIACALTTTPKILLFDEPSSNLDYTTTLLFLEILKELKKLGYTIIVAEHRLFYLKDILDKLIYIENGTVKSIYTKENFHNINEDWFRSFNIFENKYMNIGSNFGEEVLRVENVYFKDILKDISFSTKVGQITAIIGRNGVGKTTLAKLITKIEKPNKGRISVNGKPNFVMQDVDYQLFGDSVENELRVGNKNISDEEIDIALEKVGLSDFKNRHPFSLSGGQKQRLAIAQSYVSKSKLVIFDEPTSGLDIVNMRRISDFIKDISKTKAVLIISHDFEFITYTCNGAIYLNDGKVHNIFDFKKGEENKLVSIFKNLGEVEN